MSAPYRINRTTILTTETLAEYLRIELKDVYLLILNGQAPALFSVGGEMRFLGADVLDWINRLKQQPDHAPVPPSPPSKPAQAYWEGQS